MQWNGTVLVYFCSVKINVIMMKKNNYRVQHSLTAGLIMKIYFHMRM